MRPREAIEEPPVKRRPEAQHARVRALPHEPEPFENSSRPPSPGDQPGPHDGEHRTRVELPELIPTEYGEQARRERSLRERPAARLSRTTHKVEERSEDHTEAEALPIYESIEPAEESSAGSVGYPADRVAEAEAVVGRGEFMAISRQVSLLKADRYIWIAWPSTAMPASPMTSERVG